MSFKNLFIGFALVGVIALAVVSFGYNLASDNNSNQSILDDQTMSNLNSTLSANLSSFQSIAGTQRENFEAELPTAGFGTLIIFAIIGAGKIFTGMVVGVFNSLMGGFSSSRIGIPIIILGVFSAILVIVIIFSLWRLYKAGE